MHNKIHSVIFLLPRIKNADKEKIYGLEANTYNLVDGKIVKTKLNSNQIFQDETKYSTDNKQIKKMQYC